MNWIYKYKVNMLSKSMRTFSSSAKVWVDKNTHIIC